MSKVKAPIAKNPSPAPAPVKGPQVQSIKSRPLTAKSVVSVKTAKSTQSSSSKSTRRRPHRSVKEWVGKSNQGGGSNQSSSRDNQRRAAIGGTPKGPVDPYLRALVDPFVVGMQGIKVPDAHCYPSVAFKVNGSIELTTDENGYIAHMFRPTAAQYMGWTYVNSVSGYMQWTASGGAGTTFDNLPQYANMKTDYELARTVAWGVRLGFMGNRDNTQGNVHICAVPRDLYNLNNLEGLPASQTQMANMAYYECWPMSDLVNKQVVIPGRYIDVSANIYRTLQGMPNSTPGYLASTDGMCDIVIYVEGAYASKAVLQAEFVYHFEVLQKCTNPVNPAFGNEATPARSYEPTVMAKASELNKKLPTTYYREDKYSDFKDMIDQIASGVGYAVDVAGVLSKLFI